MLPMATLTSPGTCIGPNSLKQSDYSSTTVSTHMDGPITTSTNMTNSRSTPLLMIVGELKHLILVKFMVVYYGILLLCRCGLHWSNLCFDWGSYVVSIDHNVLPEKI